MIKARKKTYIEIVSVGENGDVLVQNAGDASDQWIIPKDVFRETYEIIEE